MIKLNGFGLKNVLTFEDTLLEVGSEHGLYVIHGKNLDSRNPANKNAVGKSRLFSSIPTVAFETDPLAIKSRNKKDVLKGKKSTHILEVENHLGECYRFEQTASAYSVFIKNKSGEYVNVNEAGKPVKLEIARTHLDRAFPISEEMFYATSYVSDQRSCNFINASPQNRLAFITKLFGLDVYDELRKYFTKKLGEVAKAEIEYQTLAQELKAAQKRIEELEWTSDKNSKLKRVHEKLDGVKAKLKKLYELSGKLTTAKNNADRLKKLVTKQKELQKALGKLSTKEDLAKLRSNLKLSQQFEFYVEASSEYKSKSSVIQKSLDSITKPELSTDELAEQYEKYVSLISKLERDLENQTEKYQAYIEIKKQNSKATAKASALKSTFLKTKFAKSLDLTEKNLGKKTDAISSQVDLLKTTVALWDQLQDHEHLAGCPVCGSEKVKYKDLENRVKKAQQYLEDYEIYSEYEELGSSVESISKVTIDTKLETKLESARKKLKQIREQGKQSEQYDKLIAQMDSLKKPVKPKVIVKESSESIERKIEALSLLLQNKDRIKDLGSEHYDEKAHSRVQKELKELTQENDQLEKLWRKLNLAKIEFKNLSKTAEDLSNKLKVVEPLLKMREQYKILQTAYSPNNLKLQAAEAIVRQLEDSLNRYSSLVFLEPMKFQIRTQANGISAVAIRNNGESSDIVYLSGAEANCFRLLFAVSLLPLIPEEKRTNFLILDEPDSRCSTAVREHLIREFLPKLRQIVPHIFWITPKSIDDFQDYTLLTVVKEKGSSYLEVS
jgi:DNA repair exonuclease SbcCD ATPase subunit